MSCLECNFYQPVAALVCLPRNERFGECRRHPPKSVGAPLHREDRTRAMFPIVSEDDWCGEFVEWPSHLGQGATNRAHAAFDAASHHDATGANLGAFNASAEMAENRATNADKLGTSAGK
jgi:hypothetical protein